MSDALVLRASYSGGSASMVRRLNAMVQRGRRRQEAYAALGHRGMFLVARGLRTNIGNWPAPSSQFRSYRAGGQPLRDTKRLSNSIAYRADSRGVDIGTNVPYAKALNRGMTILPKKQWLLIPLSPPLSRAENVAWPRGKAAIQARYPGSFFLAHGDKSLGFEGPGIYRKTGAWTSTRYRSKGGRRLPSAVPSYRGGSKRITRIAAAVRSIKLRKYGFLQWRPAWVKDLAHRYALWYTSPTGGAGVAVPAMGGTPDVGAKGGAS